MHVARLGHALHNVARIDYLKQITAETLEFAETLPLGSYHLAQDSFGSRIGHDVHVLARISKATLVAYSCCSNVAAGYFQSVC